MISGAFSVTNQAVHLGFSPRMAVKHTSEHEMGQIYVPQINWLLTSPQSAAISPIGAATPMAMAIAVILGSTFTRESQK